MINTVPFPITTFPVTAHTDFVTTGSTFFAFAGANQNGIDFIPLALKKGASTIVVAEEAQLSPNLLSEISDAQATLIRSNNMYTLFSEYCAKAAGNPADQLKIIGITGTKGKTTTCFLVETILRKSGLKTALISTVFNKIGDCVYPNMLTTPLADYLHQFLALCVKNQVTHVVMEVSAQALSLKRVHGISFSGAIFTNLSPDHSEFYEKTEHYFGAKLSLIEQLKKNAPFVFNTENPLISWAKKTNYKKAKYLDVSISKPTSFVYAKVADKNHPEVCSYHLYYQKTKGFRERHEVSCPALIGIHNGENIIAAIGLSIALGIDPTTATHSLLSFEPIPGRWQEHKLPNGARAIIDYAHNPISFYNVLATMKLLTKDLIVVFGAGGNRSKENRPQMGEISCMLAQKVILTTDNPRTENPEDIIRDITSFYPTSDKVNQQYQAILQKAKEKIIIELDREKAIKKAYELSGPDSIIALLGKGPDEYQIIGTEKTYFSEQKCLKELI